MSMQCPNDLIGGDHPARIIWKIVEGLDLSAFYAPIQVRAGTVGRNTKIMNLAADEENPFLSAQETERVKL
ncbi:MAG: hypothetical protein IT446_00685 [Phycisphaerales bacterium]|nr:hypothetical protein [Phycisphaerales bacterium]